MEGGVGWHIIRPIGDAVVGQDEAGVWGVLFVWILGIFFGIWYTLRVGCLVDPGVCGCCEVVGSEVY